MSSTTQTSRPPAPWTALVVEDEGIIAAWLEDLLSGMGAASVVVARTVEEATAARGDDLTVAVVDWHLGRGDASALVRMLCDLGIALVIVTGMQYRDIAAHVPSEVEVIGKPFADAEIVAAIRRAMARVGAQEA